MTLEKEYTNVHGHPYVIINFSFQIIFHKVLSISLLRSVRRNPYLLTRFTSSPEGCQCWNGQKFNDLFNEQLIQFEQVNLAFLIHRHCVELLRNCLFFGWIFSLPEEWSRHWFQERIKHDSPKNYRLLKLGKSRNNELKGIVCNQNNFDISPRP